MSDKEITQEQPETIIPVDIKKEVKESYLNYAMSVIVSRALPDARDGLKPVHRRILYSMYDTGLRYSSQTKKSSHAIGDVLARFHPHGDASVYNALVRLGQPFSMRYPLIYGQGNFGSIDGDPPAAFRYTESKIEQITEEILADIRKNTVDFVPNYDESHKEPTVLPAALPTLLLNGSTGIAVGLTTEVPPHNLREIANAIVAQVDNPDISIDTLLTHIKGPDFPTGAIIRGLRGIRKAYQTGNGSITIQSRYTIETVNGYNRIIFTEIPYAKRKAEIITRLAEQVNNEVITSIRDIRDGSSRKGIQIIIELKREANTQITLQQILKHTDFLCNYSINITALVNNRPKTLNLKEAIQIYIEHRREVITRRTQFELDEAEKRAHILRGLLIALDNIDEVIRIIRSSENTEVAHKNLTDRFGLDATQTTAILDMRLQRLTNLEYTKITEELKQLVVLIAELQSILSNKDKIDDIIKKTITALSEKYGDDRRTEILESEAEFLSEEDLIDQEDMVITLTRGGYIKRTHLNEFGAQKRGGKGKFGISLVKDDTLEHLYVGSTHETVLFITSLGRAFIQKIYQIPASSRTAKGQSIKTFLPIENNETITSVLHAPDFSNDKFLILTTKKGKIKKVTWDLLKNATSLRGIRSISLAKDDNVIAGSVTENLSDIFLFSASGRVLRFPHIALRASGRTAAGVAGLKLKTEDTIVSVLLGNNESVFTLISSLGYGKRLKAKDITPHGRNTSGVVAMNISSNADTNNSLIKALNTQDTDYIAVISQRGKTMRFIANSCPLQGRTSRGVTVVSLEKEDKAISAVISNKSEQDN